ncbi:DUF2235 domain-containing protein [Janthinobacterium sp. 17J80-10]|uniref:T6SS phospholipase effector Tle1-like catalytic domain-containing protein n=1 Tax=Janthinobacterium sp. 17J80-10 TaxID=2497863 RepID=UPI0010058555|nr:DUF2235 domain-containing protein [Janthinobacterium sp. 17J80-10]QAU35318.1 DUF2235 domain-containing protein [Janthinobacterium sp. 17J80-10]
MTAFFANTYPLEAKEPSISEQFFDRDEASKIQKIIRERECFELGFPPKCTVNLSFGFFFDGTNNNLLRDRSHHAHSNVARLYEAFPGGKDDHGSPIWPQLKDKYHNSFFRTYVPGVGTPFDEVKDSGQGFSMTDDRPKGLAFCYLGENRIIWALVEAINNVHQYYKGGKLIKKQTFLSTFNKLTLPRFKDRNYRAPSHMDRQERGEQPIEKFLNAFRGALRDLRNSLGSYVPVGQGKLMDRGEVQNIYASMFGFSRGATEARAFCNWFIWLCEEDAKISGQSGLTLGTIPVTIDFLGLFDTVASVGLAATAPVADGHQAWADAESSLKIPDHPKKCLHLVSSHEIRRSFPLDSVSYLGVVPTNSMEIVFPGVHSDIGGGYKPLEQGRGKDKEGADMIARITLAVMYRAARLVGVPLKLEEAPESVKRAFKLDPAVIEKFNAYVKHTNEHFKNPIGKDEKPHSVPLETLMAQQHQLYILWRKKMAGNMKDLPNVANSSVNAFDKTDILEADKEFEQEIKNFNKWLKWKKNLQSRPSGPSWQDTSVPPPFHNPEWTEIEKFWEKATPPAAITDFLEQFVHDSRAWFKPFGSDIPDLLHALDILAAQEEREREWDSNFGKNSIAPNPFRLSKSDREKVLKYRSVKGTPEELLLIVPDKTGREGIEPLFSVPGGYLRYRRIYMGSDSYKPAGAHYANFMHPSIEKKQIAEISSSVQHVA